MGKKESEKWKNYDKIWYLGGEKIYFSAICTVPSTGKNQKLGGGKNMIFLGKYIPL